MITAPKQDRSRKSLDLLLECAASMAAEQGFEGMSLRELCSRAGLTSGAFYARFSKKEDLGLALAERLGEEMQLAQTSAEHFEAGDFEAGVQALLENSIDLYRSHGGLIRALIAMARSHPEVALAMRKINDRLFGDLLRSLEPFRSRLSHPSPDLALSLGFLTVLNTLRELVLEQQLFETEPVLFQDDILVEELKRMLLSYLEIDPKAQHQDPS